MPTTSAASAISPIAKFHHAFPDHRLVYAKADEIKYRYHCEAVGKFYEDMANHLIIRKGWPLVTELKIWHVGGKLREVALHIKPAPEEDTILEEVPDTEGLDGGWWSGMEEKE